MDKNLKDKFDALVEKASTDKDGKAITVGGVTAGKEVTTDAPAFIGKGWWYMTALGSEDSQGMKGTAKKVDRSLMLISRIPNADELLKNITKQSVLDSIADSDFETPAQFNTALIPRSSVSDWIPELSTKDGFNEAKDEHTVFVVGLYEDVDNPQQYGTGKFNNKGDEIMKEFYPLRRAFYRAL